MNATTRSSYLPLCALLTFLALGCSDATPTTPDRAVDPVAALDSPNQPGYWLALARAAARDPSIDVFGEYRAWLKRTLQRGKPGSVTANSLENCEPIDGGNPGHCPGQPDPNPGALGYWVDGWTALHCFNYQIALGLDNDNDGVTDQCESDMAYWFSPEIQYTADCVYDSGNGRLGGDYTYAVRKTSSSSVRIAYLFAYYEDCGASQGPAAWFTSPHSGDSEFVLVDVTYNSSTQHWEVTQIRPSAHCGEISHQCLWLLPSAFSWVDVQLGAPRIWASVLKHANYPSDASCDGGAFGFDDCNANRFLRYPVTRGYYGNIGSRGTPFLNCGAPIRPSALTSSGASECWWSGAGKFDGWQGSSWGGGSSLYGNLLGTYGGF